MSVVSSTSCNESSVAVVLYWLYKGCVKPLYFIHRKNMVRLCSVKLLLVGFGFVENTSSYHHHVLVYFFCRFCRACQKVQVGKDQEKAQSEKDSHSKDQGGKKPNKQSGTYTMKTFRKPNEQLFSQ